jgi:uncharacterized protein
MAKKTVQDMTPSEQDIELKRLQILEKQLQLEDLTMRVENEKARRKAIAQAHEQAMRTLDEANKNIEKDQAFCKHKKGGKNLEGIINGNDPNYSVIKHTYATGEVEVLCSRCGKQWKEPKAALRKTDPEKYKEQMEEYREAINFPTDNEPSGTQLFMITGTAA